MSRKAYVFTFTEKSCAKTLSWLPISLVSSYWSRWILASCHQTRHHKKIKNKKDTTISLLYILEIAFEKQFHLQAQECELGVNRVMSKLPANYQPNCFAQKPPAPEASTYSLFIPVLLQASKRRRRIRPAEIGGEEGGREGGQREGTLSGAAASVKSGYADGNLDRRLGGDGTRPERKVGRGVAPPLLCRYQLPDLHTFLILLDSPTKTLGIP